MRGDSIDDKFWDYLKGLADKASPDRSLYVVNRKRYDEMMFAVKTLTEIIPNVEIVHRACPDMKSIGEVFCAASEITVYNEHMADLVEIFKLADNFEVHPIEGERISFSFTFNGIMTKKT